MNAIKVRNALVAGIFLIIIVIGVFVFYASTYLQSEAVKTTHAKIDAELSRQDIDKLKSLQSLLEKNALSVSKANKIVSDSKHYEYQDQIVRDINDYALKAGVTVTGYDFGSTTTESPSSSSKKTSDEIEGIKKLEVTVLLDSEMSFDNYLKFVIAVERNLTKMQVNGINITPSAEDNNIIINPSVKLIVYVK